MTSQSRHPFSSAAQEKFSAAPAGQFHTLILTDLSYTRLLLNRIVNNAGSATTLIPDSAEVGRIGRSRRFNLVLVDFCRREEEADRFLVEFRASGFTQPVVVFYSDARAQEIPHSAGLAPVLWIHKPLVPQQVQEVVTLAMQGEAETLFCAQTEGHTLSPEQLQVSAESAIQQMIGDLPLLPGTLGRIVSEINRPDISANEVAELVARDPGLTVCLLRLVNSAHFGLRQRINSVHHAVVFLGINTVQSLLYGLSTQSFFGTKGNFIDLRRLWRHSLGAAIVARELASLIRCPLSPGEAFTAGLLHDFGKIIWDQRLPEQIKIVKELMHSENIDGHVAEKRVLGVDHGWIGKRVGELWKFPSQLCEPMGFHHQSDRAPLHREAVCLVHVADNVCQNAGLCYWTESFPTDIDPYAQQVLGLTPALIASLSNELPKKVADVDAQLKNS